LRGGEGGREGGREGWNGRGIEFLFELILRLCVFECESGG